MKSIYDFMSKICPWVPLKLTHMPSQQNWSGMLVGKRSCSCSLQRGESEFLVLKSTVHAAITFSFGSAKWWHCRESKHHLSPLHMLSMQRFTVGRKRGPGRRLLLFPLPLQLLSWPARDRAAAVGERAKLWLTAARCSAEERCAVPGKGQVHIKSPSQQLHVDS